MAKGSRKLATGPNLLAAALVLAAGAFAYFRPGVDGSGPSSAAVTLTAPVAALEEDAAPSVLLAQSGGLPTRIVAPAAGIDTTISEVGIVRESGISAWETAWRSAGHHFTSARPGQPGNMVISGHVSVIDRHNLAVFANLGDLAAGDEIQVHSGEQIYRYIVESRATVSPTSLHVLRSSSQSRVTLITCTPDLKRRLVVVGKLVS